MSVTKEQVVEFIANMTVLELSEFIKELEEKFGVSAAAPVMVAGPAAGAAAPAAEEKTEFDVVLAGFDAAAKIKVIKVMPDTGLVPTMAIALAASVVKRKAIIPMINSPINA